jgi:hypothetical protein
MEASTLVNRKGLRRGLKGDQLAKAIARYDRKNAILSDQARKIGIDPTGKSNAALGYVLMSKWAHPNLDKVEKNRTRLVRARKREFMRGKQVPQNDEAKIRDFYDSWEWKRLSYDVRMIGHATCACCGADPKRDRVRIVCDHIKPIRRYWHLRLDAANVQILCDDCNRGKGSRDQTDWR